MGHQGGQWHLLFLTLIPISQELSHPFVLATALACILHLKTILSPYVRMGPPIRVPPSWSTKVTLEFNPSSRMPVTFLQIKLKKLNLQLRSFDFTITTTPVPGYGVGAPDDSL